jgi:hypothetical protein
MGLMTLAEIEAEVRWVVENDLDETQARVQRFIQFAYRYITNPNVYEHPELEFREDLALVAGQVQVPATAWNRLDTVQFIEATPATITNGTYRKRLYPTSMRALQMRSFVIEGTPSRYVFIRNQIHLDRAITAADVGKTLRMEGFRRAPALDFNSTTVLRDDWDHVLIYTAAMFWWTHRGAHEQVFHLKDMVARLINDMPRIQDLSAGDEPNEAFMLGGHGMRVK